MNDRTDLYALLSVSRAADPEEIRVAIRTQRRTWVRRQSSPDPARRTEAEQRVRDLDQAERTLLDPAARASYDRTLSQTGAPSGSAPTSGGPTSGAPTSGAPTSGAPTSREPASREPAGRGPAGRGPAGREPSTSEPTGADQWLVRAQDHIAREQWRQAIAAFEQVRSHRPGDVRASIGLAEAYCHIERIGEGLALLRTVLAEHPEDKDAKRVYAIALYEEAFDSLAELSDGKVALSARQVRLLRKNTKEIRELGLSDPHIDGLANHLKDIHDEASRRTKVPSKNHRYYLVLLAVGLALMLFVPEVSVQVLSAVILVGTVLLYIQRHRPPVWRVRRKQYGHEIVKRGI